MLVSSDWLWKIMYFYYREFAWSGRHVNMRVDKDCNDLTIQS